MSVTHKYHFISEVEYLKSELLSDIRHEYIEGEVYAMVGGINIIKITGEVFRLFAR